MEQAAARKKKGPVTLKEGEKIDKASLMKVGGRACACARVRACVRTCVCVCVRACVCVCVCV